MEKYVYIACCRSLGVHISKVRSIQLDAWEPELLKVTYFYFLFVLECSFLVFLINAAKFFTGHHSNPFLYSYFRRARSILKVT
jgi:hypothetical protein